MNAFRRILTISWALLFTGVGTLQAATTTDYSDQWWVPNESGWGASVLQQADVLFIDLFVYGADGKPTWFTAAASYQPNAGVGHEVFVGDLYQTAGSYFGGSWNSAAAGRQKVGTLTFDASTSTTATLSYVVNGVQVARGVTRQLWRYETLAGTYGAYWRNDCSGGTWHDIPLSGFSELLIRQNADNTVTLDVTYDFYWSDDHHQLRGTYLQAGHLGQITANFVPDTVGSITFSEIARTATGFTARFTGTIGGCQVRDGRVAATRNRP